MAGLLLLTLIGGYVALTIWIVVKIKPLWVKATALGVAILIPAADDIFYRMKLDAYCKSEAGYKIYKYASKKAGILHKDVGIGAPDYLELVSVDFGEFYDASSGEIYRYKREENGDTKTFVSSDVTAQFEFIRKEYKSKVFLESELVIVDRKTGEIFGRLSDLSYYGGWFRRGLLGSLSDSGPTLVSDCGMGVSQGRFKLINRVFIQN